MRENRKQGSARGLSGNWQSYLHLYKELRISGVLKMESTHTVTPS